MTQNDAVKIYSNFLRVSGINRLSGTLTLIFIVLKLTNLISWSWWTVFLPLLLLIAIAIIGGVGIGVYFGLRDYYH